MNNSDLAQRISEAHGLSKADARKLVDDVFAAITEAAAAGDEVSLNLFRACQEALTNIYRHAEASQAVIKLEIDDAQIRLEIADDGRGIDRVQTLGVGLSGMQERMRRLGGDVLLSSDANGTTLLVTVPRSAA